MDAKDPEGGHDGRHEDRYGTAAQGHGLDGHDRDPSPSERLTLQELNELVSRLLEGRAPAVVVDGRAICPYCESNINLAWSFGFCRKEVSVEEGLEERRPAIRFARWETALESIKGEGLPTVLQCQDEACQAVLAVPDADVLWNSWLCSYCGIEVFRRRYEDYDDRPMCQVCYYGDTCDACYGRGRRHDGTVCETCTGSGEIRSEEDLEEDDG